MNAAFRTRADNTVKQQIWRTLRWVLRDVKGYLFILPALALEGVFFGYPLLRAAYMSLHKWPVLGTPTYIGFENYTNLLEDDQFIQSLSFTVKYTFFVTPAIFVAAFGLALLVNQSIRGITLFRSVYFLPVVISFVSASLIWLWIYNDVYGLFNFVLRSLGLIDEGIVWMGNVRTSLPAIIVMITWKTAGFTMVILLAAMQSIPIELYESAALDGANAAQRTLFVTIPLLRPSIALALIVSITGSVLAFDHFQIMTRGGPANSTRTIMMYIYDTSFSYFRLGSGAAMGIVIMLLLVILSVIQLRMLQRNAVGY